MHLFYSIIYHPKINKLIRTVNYLLAPLLHSKIKIHPSGKLKLKLKNTSVSFYLKTNQTSYISKELFWDKPENFEYTPVFIDLITKINTFFDVGSNIGYYTILGSKLNSKMVTHAFEPSSSAMGYLKTNIDINGFTNRVNTLPLALSNSSSTIDFFEVKNAKYPSIPNLSGEHNMGTKDNKSYQKITVQSMTLDDYVFNETIETIDLIKIDTEGAEPFILEGAHKTIQKFRPIIICETLFNEKESEIESIMLNHNYQFFNHTKEGLKQVKTIIRLEDDNVRNCFFVPPEKTALIEKWIL